MKLGVEPVDKIDRIFQGQTNKLEFIYD